MSKLLFVALLLPAAVQAQVVECPKFYPWQDTSLAEVPYGHKGVGNLSKAPLMSGSMWGREPRREGVELIGETKKVKGGFDTRYAFGPDEDKWFACWYGKDGIVQWWEKMDKTSTNCVVEVRTTVARTDYPNDPVSVKATCK